MVFRSPDLSTAIAIGMSPLLGPPQRTEVGNICTPTSVSISVYVFRNVNSYGCLQFQVTTTWLILAPPHFL